MWKLRKASFPSLPHWWDRGKERIKGLAIKFCSAKAKEEHASRSLLSSLALHLKLKIDAGQVSFLSIYQNVLAEYLLSLLRMPRVQRCVPELSGLKKARPPQDIS